jgi:hypothetical protein
MIGWQLHSTDNSRNLSDFPIAVNIGILPPDSSEIKLFNDVEFFKVKQEVKKRHILQQSVLRVTYIAGLCTEAYPQFE